MSKDRLWYVGYTMVKKINLIMIMSISVLLVSCAKSKGNDTSETTSIKQLEISSNKDDTSIEVTTEQLPTEEITTSTANKETWNSPEEGETLCFYKYSDEQFDEMRKHFENIMSEEMYAYYKQDTTGWVTPSSYECILLGNVELNPSVDNEIYSIKPMQYERHNDDVAYHIQIYAPHIEIKGNKEATDIVNEEIKKFIASGYYGMSEEEFLSIKNPTLNGDWFSYYAIGYMDDKMISIIFRDSMRIVQGLNINIKTGKAMTLEEMGVTDEMLLEILDRKPDHIVSGLYKRASRDQMKLAIDNGWMKYSNFIVGNRLYVWTTTGRAWHIYFGYDGILEIN